MGVTPPLIFNHGPCEHAGCSSDAIFRVGLDKLCQEHKGSDVIFAPFLGQQEKFFQRRERVVFTGGAVAGGKAMPLGVMIPTPTGWVANGDISVGDHVIGSDGRPVRVVALSEVITDEDSYRLTFNDGTSIVAGENHLWRTLDDDDRTKIWRRSEEYRAARRVKRPSRAVKNTKPWLAATNSQRRYPYKPVPGAALRTTKEISESLRTRRGQTNHCIEQHLPLDLTDRGLPVPPYTLGAWLGDGTAICGQVTGNDDGVFERIEADGYRTSVYANGRSRQVLGLVGHLRSAGVLGNKHIPAVYMRASLLQRLALLQGLMDTDGWCEKDGSCKISLTCKPLFDGVVELLRTFGFVVHLTTGEKTATNGAPGNRTRAWQATFATGMRIFTLKRKYDRQRIPTDRWTRRYIEAAENLGPVPMRCIQIENADGMYLAGEQLVPTHNSLVICMKFGQQLAVEHRRFMEAKKKGLKFRSKAWGLYLRRTTPNFKQMVQRSYEFFQALDPAAKFNENTFCWEFPSCGGAVFQFGHMEHEKDKYKYKSTELSYLAPDELTEFTETQIDYIETRLRTSDPQLEPYLQMCPASNPDGEGLIWVRERFIEPVPPETVMRIETKLADGRVISYDQIYIPTKLTDNPILMASGAYEASLMNKRPEVREALLEGNWYVAPGAFLANIWDSSLHVVEDHDVPHGAKIFRAADWGINNPSSIGWFYQDGDGGLTMFAHLRTIGMTVDKVCEKIRVIEMDMGLWDEEEDQSGLNFQRNPLDSSCFGTGQGLIGARTIAKDFKGQGVRWISAKKGPGSRLQGASQIILRLTKLIPASYEGATEPTERERPMLRFMARCKSPIKTVPVLKTDPNNADDVDTDGDDHDWDMLQYACLQNPVAMPSDDDRDDDEDELYVPPRQIGGRKRVGLGEGPWTR